MENPLKHAGAYSAEEVIRIMRDKLIRLQKLYIDQFQRLQYLLKEERRQYKTALRKEHEAELMSIQKQPKETPEDKIAYDQLKALNHYNKPAGRPFCYCFFQWKKEIMMYTLVHRLNNRWRLCRFTSSIF